MTRDEVDEADDGASSPIAVVGVAVVVVCPGARGVSSGDNSVTFNCKPAAPTFDNRNLRALAPPDPMAVTPAKVGEGGGKGWRE